MRQDPDNPSPANNLAVVYMSMGKFKEAKEILEGQLERHPGNKALKYNYDECLKNLK
jgi:Flp pilus assembly protein TadD